jgi:RNA polymerase sigma-70 factor (ECF subfamily)
MSAAEPTDAELLASIRDGDAKAVGLLYERHVGVLFPMVLRILRDRSESEDVLHDAFVALSERASQYVPERGSVVAWLVTLVRNLAIDRTRKRGRRGDIQRNVIAHEPPASTRNPEAHVAHADVGAKVRKALASLSDSQRETLEIAFFEGLTYPEIAEREGVPLGTIKSRAARAIAALREALEQEVGTLDFSVLAEKLRF